MKYITDTDFLPEFSGLQNDAYQIIYGTAFTGRETAIYNNVIINCRDYTNLYLRRSKIDYWQSLTDEVIDKLKYYKNHEQMDIVIHIPYRLMICPLDIMIRRFIFLQKVLQNIRNVDTVEALEIQCGKFNFLILSPLPRLMQMSYNAISKFYKIEKDKVQEMIEGELFRRGLLQKDRSSSNFDVNLYRNYFFNAKAADVLPKIKNGMDDNSQDSDEVIKGNKVRNVGILYYALDYFFNQIRVSGKKQYFDILNDATWTIAHALYKPTEILDKKHLSESSEYIYVNQKRFNNNDTAINTIRYIMDVLTNCGINIPRELSKKYSK